MTPSDQAAGGGPVVPQWTLSDRLRKAREQARLNQAQLAEQLHVAKRTIVNYEAGSVRPNPWVLVGWARVTNVDEEWLVGLDVANPPAGFRTVLVSLSAA